MVDKLGPDEVAAFKDAFDMFDKNSDGTISTKVMTAWKNRAVENTSSYGQESAGWISLFKLVTF